MSDSQRLRAVIEGDARGAVRAFDQVADGAERMGKDVERGAKQAGRSLQEMQDRAKRAEEAGRQLAKGAALLGSAFVVSARSATTQRREIESLERAYGDNAAAILEWTQAIEENSNVSDESARKAALFASTLSQEYGLSLQQVQALLERTADVAEDRGFAFEDASQRIVAAIRGEAESAEVLGVVANDSALGIDHLSKSTTDAEKAQIRFNAIMEQTSESAGVAAQAADTTRGRVIDLANDVTDASQRFADWTGPIGVAAGELGSFTLQAGLAAGGVVQLGRGLVTAAPLVAGLATGPVGLGILAAGAIAAGAAFLLLRDDASEFEQGVEAAAAASDTLREAIDRLAAAGDSFALRADAVGIQLETISAATIQQATQDLPALNAELRTATDQYNVWELNIAGAGRELEANGFVAEEAKARIADLTAEVKEAEGAAQAWADAEIALADIFDSSGPGRDKAIANVLVLIDAYNAQTDAQKETEFTAIELAQAITETGANIGEYNRQAIAATESTEALGEAAEDTSKSIGVLFTGTKELSDRLKAYEEGAGRAAIAEQEVARRREETAKATERLSDRLREYEEGGDRAASAAEDAIFRIGQPPAISIPEFVAPASLAEARSQVDALTGAYFDLGAGILNANGAQAIFKGTQDGLIAAQAEYTHQQSEYTQQLNALQEAEDILNQRRAEGIALTAEQEDYLNRVDAAQERLTGGAEDAAIAEGMLALQYAENVRIGDQLNSTMEGQQAITSALIGLVADLIAQLQGIPSDVRTNVELVGADHAINQAASLAGTLASIPLSKRIDIVTAFSQTGTPPALAGLGGGIALQHGGVVPHAQHGIVTRGGATPVVVGEAGPEIAFLPGGTYVSPNPASRAAGMGSGGGEVHLHIYGNVYGVDDIHATVNQALRAYNYAAGR